MKRLISMLLLSALLVSLAACKETASHKDNDEQSVAETEVKPANIEKQNYDKTFNILYPDWGLYPNYFVADDDNTADVMGKALYERELLVEEYLGVDITNTQATSIDDIQPMIMQMVMSGDDTYQLALTHCIASVSAMITEDVLLDLNTTDIDFTADWWNHNANEALEVGGKQYYAISDYMLPDPNCILVNLDMIEEYKLDDPYTLVRDKGWTIDKMIEMAEAVTLDNGDNVWNEQDQWGLSSGMIWWQASFTYSSGLTLVNKNSDGEFELAFGVNERTNKLMEKMDKLFNTGVAIQYWQALASEADLHIGTGRILFNISTLNQLHNFRDYEVNFGILPYPMLDESQDGYYNNDWSGLMCVPKTVANPDMVADVIELLSYYSADTVIPAYYDLVLDEKLSRDDGSKEMLDIIFDGIVFDAGMNYFGFGDNMEMLFYAAHYGVLGPKQNNFASHVAKYEMGAKNEIAAFNEAVSD